MVNQNEIWKPIQGSPDYEVSDLGRVRSLKYGKAKVLKLRDCRGYCIVDIRIKGVRKTKTVHRLVAAVFLGASDLHIDHIDMVKTNNCLTNLRYCTHRENHTYRSLASETSSKYTGVSWYKRDKKWRAQIYINKRFVHLGFFDDERIASQAYQNALAIHKAGGTVLSAKEQKMQGGTLFS